VYNQLQNGKEFANYAKHKEAENKKFNQNEWVSLLLLQYSASAQTNKFIWMKSSITLIEYTVNNKHSKRAFDLIIYYWVMK